MANAELVAGLFAIGVLTGLRTMTPIAVLCWMTALSRIAAATGWMAFVSSRIALILFTLAAIAELIGDKMPKTPSRTGFPGLPARLIFGGLCAAIVASALGFPIAIGALAGVLGAIAGTYGGWFIRTRAVKALRCPDLPIALVEDAVAVGGSVLAYLLLGN
jgi:uncharacterized membrane protein